MIKNKVNWIIALGFWLFILQVRVFRKTNDFVFSDKLFHENKYLFGQLFFITLLLSLTTAVLFFVLLYIKPKNNNQEKNFVQKHFSWLYAVLTYLDGGKKELYTKLFNRLKNYKYIFISLTYNFLTHYMFSLFLLFSGIIIPRVAILCCLVIEIYLGHLKYYYYFLILLIIPLIIQLIIYMLKDIGPRLNDYLKEYVIIDKIKPTSENTIEDVNFQSENKNENSLPDFYDVSLKKEYSYYDFDLFMKFFFIPLTTISGVMETKFLPLYAKIRLITLFFYFFIQALCWGYIYFYIL